MRMAIGLAKKGEGNTSPNPLVGAVLVKNGKVIGRGYHKRAGLPHAEINAIRDAGARTQSAALYVTLEPCDHFGRTPPCTDAIIKSGIKEVIVGMKDPNPINNGRGIKKLKAHKIKTVVGVLGEKARSINKPYIKFITKNMPYVTIKVAESLDGKIATKTGDSKWITSRESRHYVHELRGKVDAVMVGVNTVIKDDPMLTNRCFGKKQPVRIIVDTQSKTPLSARIFSTTGQSALIITAIKRSPLAKQYEDKGAKVLMVKNKNGRVDLKELLKILAKDGISHILVEGGGELTASLIEEKLVDKLLFFIAPKIIGGKSAKTPVEGSGVVKVKDALMLKNINVKRFSDDILIEAEII